MPPPEGVSERPVAFAVRWVDEKGRDAAESELALGMSDPTLRATLGNSKERLPVEITGAAARSSISRGMLEIVVPPVGKGAVFEVREERPIPTSGAKPARTPGTRFYCMGMNPFPIPRT
jgi:hypothetical protein